MTKRDELSGKGYFVERAVLSMPDVEICKSRLREVARHIDYYRDKIRLIVDVQDESYRDHPDPLRRFRRMRWR